LLLNHRSHEAIEISLQSIEISQRIGDLRTQQGSPWVLAQALLTVGEPDRAIIHVNSAFQAAEKLHDRVFQTSHLLVSACCAAYQGDWSKASELASRSEEILPSRELQLSFEAEISLDINDAQAIKRLIEYLSDDPNATIHISARLIRTAYETGNNEYLDIGEAILNSEGSRTNGLQRFWIEHYSAIAAALKHDTTSAADTTRR
jgi:tetratricopeptide (TPR) repeat protein